MGGTTLRVRSESVGCVDKNEADVVQAMHLESDNVHSGVEQARAVTAYTKRSIGQLKAE